MSGYRMVYTAVFSLYSLMEVVGLMPQEIHSAGITLPSLFSSYYGDQVWRYLNDTRHSLSTGAPVFWFRVLILWVIT